MRLVECMARSLAITYACNAGSRASSPPPGRYRETWKTFLPEAIEILESLSSKPMSDRLRREITHARSLRCIMKKATINRGGLDPSLASARPTRPILTIARPKSVKASSEANDPDRD